MNIERKSKTRDAETVTRKNAVQVCGVRLSSRFTLIDPLALEVRNKLRAMHPESSDIGVVRGPSGFIAMIGGSVIRAANSAELLRKARK